MIPATAELIYVSSPSVPRRHCCNRICDEHRRSATHLIGRGIRHEQVLSVDTPNWVVRVVACVALSRGIASGAGGERAGLDGEVGIGADGCD